jgi:hypothetical protein
MCWQSGHGMLYYPRSGSKDSEYRVVLHFENPSLFISLLHTPPLVHNDSTRQSLKIDPSVPRVHFRFISWYELLLLHISISHSPLHSSPPLVLPLPKIDKTKTTRTRNTFTRDRDTIEVWTTPDCKGQERADSDNSIPQTIRDESADARSRSPTKL